MIIPRRTVMLQRLIGKNVILLLPASAKLRNIAGQILLLVGSGYDIHALDAANLFGTDLCIAACHRHYRIRIKPLHLADVLPGLAIRQMGHRTGIDHINVREGIIRNDLAAFGCKLLLHGFCLVLVDFAA